MGKPHRLQSRVTATVRVPTAGSTALGSLLGGFLGSAAGPGPTLVVASGGTGLAVLWVALSPLRRLRQVEKSGGRALKPLRIPVGRRFPCGSPDAGGASLAHRPAPGYDAEPIRPRRAGKQMQHVRQESGVHDR